MPGSVEHRSVTPFIKYFRAFLRGDLLHSQALAIREPDDLQPIRFIGYTCIAGEREGPQALRYTDEMATRSPPHPELPGGPYHKTSKIYYYTRDARREVQPPITVFAANKQIAEGDQKTTTPLKLITPNEPYNPVN